MEEKSVKWFSEINKSDKEQIGEKAYFLAEAHNKKIQIKDVSIPEAFIITKKTINHFLEKNNIRSAITNILEEINKNDSEELFRAETKISELITKASFDKEIEEEILDAYETLGASKIDLEKGSAYDILSNSQEPIFIAIRTSNNENLGDSHFNIKGNTALLGAIKKCLKSLFTKENLKNKSPEKIETSIIIQKQIQSDKSGIVNINDIYQIQAIWGIGCGLRQEEIGKDIYEIRRDGRILNKQITEKKYAITRDSGGSLKAVQLKEGYSFGQVLEEYEMQKLADVALRFEDIFEENIEFHFAIENDEFFIVTIQKPTETIAKTKNPESKVEEIEENIEKEIIETLKQNNLEEEILIHKTETSQSILPIQNLTQTKLELIINTKEEGELAKKTLVKSGILNIENIIKQRGIHPLKYIENFNTKGYQEVLYSGISETSKNLESFWVKLSDFTSEDFKDLDGASEEIEKNPLMGLNGIKFLLSQPELLKRELKAISLLKNEGKNVGVLIPKISSVYELKKVREFLKEAGSDLNVGIILETPASIQLIKDFLEENIDAIFFNGDTLTQYLLAIDPENKNVKEFYDNTSPALMYQLEYVIRVCKRRNVKTGFYGEATNKKEMIEYLIKKGIDTILTTPDYANKTANEIEKAEQKFIEGTDKEKRQYEINKEKERQQKELEEFEKIKEKQIETEIASYKKEEEKDVINDIDEAIKTIEEEKQEYLKQNQEEIKNSISEEISDEVQNAIEELQKEKEEYKKEIEDQENLGPNDRESKDLAEVEAAIHELENQKIPQTQISQSEVSPNLGLPPQISQAPSTVEEAIKLIEQQNQESKKNPRSQIPQDVKNAIAEIENHKTENQETSIDEAIKAIEEEKQEYLEENPEEIQEILDLENQLPEDIEELEIEEECEEPEIKQEVLYDPTKTSSNNKTNEKTKISENGELTDDDFEDELLNLLEDEPEIYEEIEEEQKSKDDPLGIF